MKILVVVDMQNDFIDAALGTKEAQAIVENVRKKIEGFEGKNLPVKHCIEGSEGWQISSALPVSDDDKIIDKPTFGSKELGLYLEELAKENTIDEIEVIGLCTDICVISNALLIKAFLPQIPVTVDSSCCAGVTSKSHETALEAMKMCQINII